MSHLQEQNSEHTLPESVDNTDAFPTSFAQQRLWFLDRLLGASGLYNIPWAIQLNGKLDVSALQQSLDAIVARHEVLRTCFAEQDGEPVQVISAAIPFACTLMDLSVHPQENQDSEIQRLLDAEANKAFDLKKAPLIRAMLLKLSGQEHILLVTIHHIISDGWSMGVFRQELASLYRAFSQGQAANLPELPIQYADYAVWQREWLQGQVLERQLSYWKTQLADLTLLELPADRPRPKQQSYRGARETIHLSASLTQGLKTLSQQQNVTLFMTLLAAFQVLLHRYSGQDDIVVGTAIAGRNRQELENLIGFFVNTLALRIDLSGTPSFVQLLSRVRGVCLSAYAHQDIPFEKLVAELQVQRDMSRHPLFQVMLVLQPVALQEMMLPDLKIKKLTLNHETAKFDLSLSLVEHADGLTGMLDYSTDLFNAETITRLAGHFQTLLAAIALHPETAIAELPLLTTAERHQLLVEWNATQTDYPEDQCIHQLFEAQVARTPAAIALVFEEQQLSYHALNAKANQLAHYLQSVGVKPDTLVAICMERSIDLVIGLLAILKAGGAYVPLDPTYPQERLAFMLEDTNALGLLTHSSQAAQLPSYPGLLVCLDKCWIDLEQESIDNPSCNASSNNLAYVIYTSGSTGIPKGVMIPHTALVNHMSWMQNVFPLTSDDKVLQKTPFGFDASVWEFFAPLISGAQLILAAPELNKDIPMLAHVMKQKGITVIQFVPSVLEILKDCSELSECVNLKRVYCGGETLNSNLLRGFLAKIDVSLCNLYGPTEACIDAIYWLGNKNFNQPVVPIGRPIHNTRIYILDHHLQPVPIGVSGEIYIGGAGLARGYLNRPELTAEKFVEYPFSDDPHARLYKTGDLARYLSDGTIEFLGRIDHQVKLRGFRIELGEIESILRQYPPINDALVVVNEYHPDDKRLVAYLKSSQQEQCHINDLRHYLRQKLPEYMVPSAFVLLDCFPLTPNGKIDRKALPAPDQTRPEIEQFYVPPRSPVEEMLAAIWREVLNVDRIGIHDDFFELGGHSLLAVQLNVRINKQFQIELPLHLLFEEPTIAGLSALLTTTPEQTPAANITQIHAITRALPIPASFAQQRLWFLDRLLGASGLYNIPWAVQLKGKLDVSALQESFNALVARHESLRTCLAEQDGEPVQVIRELMPFACTLMDLSALPQENQDSESQRLLDAEANKAFDLKQVPLIRALLLKLSGQEHILLVTIHHIISDGWSMGVFRQELANLYRAFSQGQAANLPELPIQYADYAAWQREWLQGEVLERQLSYWKTQLADLTVLELPADKPRPKQLSYRGARQAIQLSDELTRGLKTLSQQQNVTLFMTLLAALQVLLHRYSGQDNLVVGTAIAGRNRQELENLIGFFVNTLALRTDLSGTPGFCQLLSRVREVCLSAYAHQDIPFEKLVAELQVKRDMSRHPLFQVMLVLQPTALQDLQLPGLTASKLTVTNETAKFDLAFSLVEHADGLTGTIEYSTDLFNAETITRLAGHFQTLLEAIALRPETTIAELPLLTAPERQQLLVEWNATHTDYPKDQCIHQLFEAQVARTPDAIALVFEEQQLSYRALNAKANQLAHYLQSVGVKPDTLVAICMERSIDLVIGLLAILKAGGAYVPLDSTYPPSRLAFMLEDAFAKVIIVKSLQSIQLNDYTGQIIAVNGIDADEAIAQQPDCNPSIAALPSQPAYMVYTSGSTGEPKGVVIAHQAVIRLIINTNYIELTAADRVAQVSNISFDAATFEIWGALLTGARLIILPKELLLSVSDFSLTLKSQGISTLFLTTAFFNEMVKTVPGAFSSLTNLLFGGEAVTPSRVRELLEHKPPKRLLHVYGPTETTTFATWFEITNVAEDAATIPIGRPLANTRLYVLDKHLQPVPVGITGELYIGGDGVALGYHNRPVLNNERFLPDPFNQDSGRLYKTGDLVHYLPDGAIEFLGRVDHQVKLRGFRIELGEIEAVLGQYPGINEVVVTVREDQPGDKRLVAYLTHSQLEPPNIKAIRLFLKEKLPDYMVPSAFVLLDKLPLSPNGKIDRKALPEPEQTRPENEQSYVPPRSPIEEMLAAIWREVLHVDRIGIHDNFFELGGHSLLAVILCTKIEAKMGNPIPVELIFKFPTINGLSDALEKLTSIELKNFNSIVTAFQIEGTQPPIFWLYGGKIIPPLLEQMGADQPFYLLNHQSMDGNKAEHLTIPEMANYYLQNILQIDPEGPYYLGGYSIGGMIIYEIARQLCEQGKKVALLFLLDPISISHDKKKPKLPRQNLNFRSEYTKLKNLGYITYFLSKTRLIKKKFQKQLEQIRIQTYFSLGKTLPLQLHWPYLLGVYMQARQVYQPGQPLEGIKKAVFIHVNDREIGDWINLFSGNIETYAVDCRHLQLIETPHIFTWLKIFKQAVKESMGR